jgi:hypothetical protein
MKKPAVPASGSDMEQYIKQVFSGKTGGYLLRMAMNPKCVFIQ